ncbi:hypothetical protein GGR34_001554 [Microvirga flocculans]|uniref:Uncharacterized protein n=1 Tax=Microvirga flocculans TaxID=217168 RepID=A0A7W6IEB4_9HYPH|nr:hypothetical protein [Microvirga flocculans]MBB4039907.1 hypothetical protein [Microvirga flocculans]
MMKRLIKAAFAALSLLSAVTVPTAASAHWRHGPWHHHVGWHPGPAAAVGALTGLALGSAIAASSRPYHAVPGPTYVAGPYPVYARHVAERTCVTDRWREWVPGWGWQAHRRTVCH